MTMPTAWKLGVKHFKFSISIFSCFLFFIKNNLREKADFLHSTVLSDFYLTSKWFQKHFFDFSWNYPQHCKSNAKWIRLKLFESNHAWRSFWKAVFLQNSIANICWFHINIFLWFSWIRKTMYLVLIYIFSQIDSPSDAHSDAQN